MPELVRYEDVVEAVEPTGLVARGGFATKPSEEMPPAPDGQRARCAVIVGNIGGVMWPRFRDEETDDPEPLDAWTRSVLVPIAAELGAAYVHPSDKPYQPFQRWAQRADDVWPSPIGLLIHAEHGLWHAYRGALLFPYVLDGLPPTSARESPCLSCADQPCLTTCPVGAFTPGGYDSAACAAHVRSDAEPDCLHLGCAARLACPVNADGFYGPDQMLFHMRAFVGSTN
jgi:hypothetical protein